MAITNFDKHAMAATFAEAGEHETAREMLAESKSAKKDPVTAPHARKPYLQTVIFGIISLSAYLYVFSNEKLVTDIFTRGGVYAAWPIGTALFFSFIHGAFGSNLLSVLGLEAKKK
ncbi:MAG: hypothetical protein KKG47_14095 [Proteobacteria bacterium]|nr:hypothetical protein [Pseudomonadota bacterium]MBU1737871.1 hypothetical protein [Pseudomonadota bacterium]